MRITWAFSDTICLPFKINKPDNPSDSGWLGGWRRGNRAVSESEGSSSIKLDIMSWLTGSSQENNLPIKRLDIRRGSSKDVEEAMSGGLSKV